MNVSSREGAWKEASTHDGRRSHLLNRNALITIIKQTPMTQGGVIW